MNLPIESKTSNGTDQPPDDLEIRNMADPIKLTNLRFDGFAANRVRKGEICKVVTRVVLTSDEQLFHELADNLVRLISSAVARVGLQIDLWHADSILLVLRSDGGADLWVNTAAVAIEILAKRSLEAGSPVFDKDIADIKGIRFPAVELGTRDRIVYLFRKSWRFGLFIDLNHDASLDIDRMARDIGNIYRRLTYRHLYQAMENSLVSSRLADAGWFPFVEIIGDEFRTLISACDDTSFLKDAEAKLVQGFDDSRIDHMFARWLANPRIAPKELILKSAISAYKSNDPVAVLKIVLTEIEGILAEEYMARTGESTRRISKLLSFAKEVAEQKSGSGDTLLFPSEFVNYLENHTYSSFDRGDRSGMCAGSRHAVGHGAAVAESYTQLRALQSLLTLDQLVFYF